MEAEVWTLCFVGLLSWAPLNLCLYLLPSHIYSSSFFLNKRQVHHLLSIISSPAVPFLPPLLLIQVKVLAKQNALLVSDTVCTQKSFTSSWQCRSSTLVTCGLAGRVLPPEGSWSGAPTPLFASCLIYHFFHHLIWTPSLFFYSTGK